MNYYFKIKDKNYKTNIFFPKYIQIYKFSRGISDLIKFTTMMEVLCQWKDMI